MTEEKRELFMYHYQHLRDADNMFKTNIGWESFINNSIIRSPVEHESVFCVFTGVECLGKNSCRNCKIAFDPCFDKKRQNIYEYHLKETIKRFGVKCSDDTGLFTTKRYEQPLPKKEGEK